VTSLYSSTVPVGNVGYPFTLAAIGNIVGSSLGDGTYPFCYDLQVEGTPQACNLNVQRAAVTAFVTTPPSVTLNGLAPVYLHTDLPVSLTVSPAGGQLSGNGINGNQFYPALAGIGQHEIRYTFAMGQCSNFSSRYVTVEFDSASIVDGYTIQVLNTAGTGQQLFVQTKENTKVEVMLMNTLGQQLWRKDYAANIGSNRFDLPLSTLPRGVYIVRARLASNGFKKAVKLIR
ncbi:MAG: T9SS type A sorting domain-containing protein, partial [Chitinophagaceae bacterium]